jgi:hypothetical protein
VEKQTVWLSAHMPYEHVAEALERIGHIGMCSATAWHKVQHHGAQAQAVEQAQRAEATAVPSRREPIAGNVRQGPRQGVALDGGMVHIRGEGWKELKLGCHFNVGVHWERDPRTRDWEQCGQAQNMRYVAHLGGPEEFGRALYTLAYQQGWTRAADTEVLGDGAEWIWNQAKEHFFDSRQAVDWYHADQHLAGAGKLLHGDGTPQAHAWWEAHRDPLFQGQAAHIAAALLEEAQRETKRQPDSKRAEALKTAAGYFHDNQRRMQYQELREELWLIGSGIVESGAKQYKARFAGPGMQWSRPGFNALLPFRSALMGGEFDVFWKTVQNREKCPGK